MLIMLWWKCHTNQSHFSHFQALRQTFVILNGSSRFVWQTFTCVIFFLFRYGGGYMPKSSIYIRLPAKHRRLHCDPRPSRSHQTHSPPWRFLLLWVLLKKSRTTGSLFVSLLVTSWRLCPCVSFLSRLWRPGEEPVGMRSIPNVTLVLTRRMKNYLPA